MSIICKYRPVSTKLGQNIYVHRPISTKLGQNIYVQQNLNGSIGLEQVELFALEFGKIATFDFVYSLASTKYKPISTKLGHNEYEHRSQKSLIMG